jgi:hypothetical protein
VRTVSADYFTEIEAHFARRRGTPFVLSAKDWALMQEWSAAEIPLPVVIEAIDSVFDKKEAKGQKVNGLRYCRHAVKELWDERRELQIGSESVTPEEDPFTRLETLAAALESTPAGAYADRVRALRGSVPHIEEQLMELETLLIEDLLPRAPELRAEAEALVAGADEKTRARSLDAHVRRLVRERFEIPRLSLF